MVESSSDDILKDADKVDVAFLVVGDPFGYIIQHHKGMTISTNTPAEPQHIPISSSAPANSPSLPAPFPMPVS
jgi:hypothetical protein